MPYQTPLTVKETLDRIARGRLVLPAIQREFVWVSDLDRMTRLFDSLLRRYPIGTFLFWDVPADQSKEWDFYEVMRVWHERDQRHNPRVHLAGPRDLTAILDGQQRLTTLNIGLYGSIAQRAKWKRANSLDAYPTKYLYVDLLYEPDGESDVEYRFEFLTKEQAENVPGVHWYKVGEIMGIDDPGLPILRYVNRHRISERERPFEVLSRLWNAIHHDGVISAFEERGEELSRVLDIFVRVNSGGVVLSKSDLLLSVATAQFRERDAREAIHQLVDELNSEGAGFSFSKDLVLKAGLVLTNISDIGFRVENFTKSNMERLEENWDRIATALKIAVRLLSSFGFSNETLPAASVLIPLADYIYQRDLSEKYIDSAAPVYRQDRKAVQSWIIRTILMPGIWGSGLDGLLRGLHKAVMESTDGFPVEAIEAEMARRGKALVFDDTLIDDLADTPYKDRRAFALLTLLYDTVDTLSKFHIDHVFPRSLATSRRLRAAGVPDHQIDDVLDRVERLANLQLLHGPVNLDKRAVLPAEWVRTHISDPVARQAWLAGNDLGQLPDSYVDFLRFYERRRALMRARLVTLLGADRPVGSDPPIQRTPAPTPPPPRAPAQDLRVDAVRRSGTTNVYTPTETSRPAVDERPITTPQFGDRSKHRFIEKFVDLVDGQRLRVGQLLYLRYRGSSYEATVEEDGLRFQGRTYEHPTAAAQVIMNGSINGWLQWKTRDGRNIGSLRRQ